MRSAEKRPSPARKKILLIDDHPFMRMGLAQLINQQPDMVVGGEAGDPAEAARVLDRDLPDLVLTDITMPGRSGLEFIKDLKATRPDLRILVVSMHDELIYAERVLRAGAQGYVMKEAGGETAARRDSPGARRSDLRQLADVRPDSRVPFGAEAQGLPLADRTVERPGIRGLPDDRAGEEHAGNRRSAPPEPEDGRRAPGAHQREAGPDRCHGAGPARGALGRDAGRRLTRNPPGPRPDPSQFMHSSPQRLRRRSEGDGLG